MRTAIAILLLSAITAIGQTFGRSGSFRSTAVPVTPVSGRAAFVTPTNTSGWWIMDNAIANTLGNITNVPDSSGLASALTNKPTYFLCTNKTAYVNGHNAAQFPGTAYDCLWNASYDCTQPCEFWEVLNYDAAGANSPCISSASSSGITFKPHSGAGTSYGGVLAAITPLSYIGGFPTNKWIVLEIVGAGTSSAVWTNNVLNVSGDAGQLGGTGIVLMGGYNLFSVSKGYVAEVIAYKGTNDANGCNAIYSYLTNKYAITP